MKVWLTLLLCLLLAACSVREEPRDGNTIAALSAAPASNDDGDDGDDAAVEPLPAVSTGDRRQAIAAYRRFLDQAPDSELRAEAMRRLADLQLEETEAQAERGTLEAAQPDAAIELYETLLREHPGHPRNDQVLYQLARAYEYRQRPEAAMTAMDRLVREHPDSPLVAETHFRRAEALFAGRDYAAAAAAYREVLALDETPFYEQSLYKLAWALYRQNQYEDSIATFMDLLDHRAVEGRIQPERLERADRERIEDSLRAVALAFSHLDGAAAVSDYFERHGGRGDEEVIYNRLAAQYLDQERYSEAAATFRAYVDRHPTDRQAPTMQRRVIDSYRSGGFPSQVLAAKREYVELFDLDGPFWQHHDRADHPEVIAELESNLGDLARHHHARYQRGGGDSAFEAASRWYRHYLKDFGATPAAQEMYFLFAELLFEHGRYADAVAGYERSAYRFDDGEQAATAGYAALLAYDRHAAALADEDPEDAAVEAWERQSLASAHRFTESFPGHPEAPRVLARSIERHFELGDGLAAAAAAERLLERYPQAPAPLRLTAWSTLGHVRFDEQDYPGAEAAYQEALQLPELPERHRRSLTEAHAASIYHHAERLRDDGELATAVDEFLRVPASRVRAVAEYDAATLLLRQRRWAAAADVLEAFRQGHPEHELQPQVTRRLAIAYSEAGQPRQAAREFERIAGADDDAEVRREAQQRAAELYGEAGDREREVAALESYVERFAEPLDAQLEARQRLLEIHLEQDQPRLARTQREAIIAADRTAGDRRSDRSRYLAAQASLALAEEAREAFRAVTLREPLEQSLARKQRRMEEALRAYEAAAGYRVTGVTTAATFHSAEIYAELATALLESERPDDLDEFALDEYELLLEEQAFPFEEQAIELHEINIARTDDGVFDRWVQQSYQRLAELMPARYRKPERSVTFVETMD